MNRVPNLVMVMSSIRSYATGVPKPQRGGWRAFKYATGISTVIVGAGLGYLSYIRAQGPEQLSNLLETMPQTRYGFDLIDWSTNALIGAFTRSIDFAKQSAPVQKAMEYIPKRKNDIEMLTRTSAVSDNDEINHIIRKQQSSEDVVGEGQTEICFNSAMNLFNKCVEQEDLLCKYLISIVKLAADEEPGSSMPRPPLVFVEAIDQYRELLARTDLSNQELVRLKQSIAKLMSLVDVDHIVRLYKSSLEQAKNHLARELNLLSSLGIDDDELTDKLLIAHSRVVINRLQAQLEAERRVRELRVEKETKTRIDKRLSEIKEALMSEVRASEESRTQATLQEELRKCAVMMEAHNEEMISRERSRIERGLREEMQEALMRASMQNHRDMAEKESKLEILKQMLMEQQLVEQKAQQAQQVWIEASRLSDSALRHCDRLAVMASLHKLKGLPGRMPFTDEMIDILSERTTCGGPIFSFEELTRRFHYVRRVADHLIGINEHNCSLLDYSIAFLHSVWRRISGHRRVMHFNSDGIIDRNLLSTTDALAIASGFVSSGDLQSAVRILSLVEGEPRNAVSSWVQDTLRFLEIQQCCELISALATCECLHSSPSLFPAL